MDKERTIIGRVAGTEVSYSELPSETTEVTVNGKGVARKRRVRFSMRPRRTGWSPVYPRWNDWLFAASLVTLIAGIAACLLSTWANTMSLVGLLCWLGWWRASKQRDHLEAWLADVHDREDIC